METIMIYELIKFSKIERGRYRHFIAGGDRK